jgi:hypothetical protein
MEQPCQQVQGGPAAGLISQHLAILPIAMGQIAQIEFAPDMGQIVTGACEKLAKFPYGFERRDVGHVLAN